MTLTSLSWPLNHLVRSSSGVLVTRETMVMTATSPSTRYTVTPVLYADLAQSFKKRFAKISQSQSRPLLGPNFTSSTVG